jgi:uncharacterized protein DUF885
VIVRCVACGGETAEDALRCPACGLRFGPAREGSSVAPAAPQHIGLDPGDTPAAVAAADEERGTGIVAETPPAPRPRADPRVVRRRRIVDVSVAAVVVAVAVFVVRLHRPDDRWTYQEAKFERFEASPRLACVALPGAPSDDGPPGEDPATAVPLPDPRGATVHQFFDAFLDRARAILPDRATRLDGTVDGCGVRGDDPATWAAWRRLCDDAARTLRAWPDDGHLSPHDRADVAALLGWVEWNVRWRSTADADLLHLTTDWFDPLVRLQVSDAGAESVRLEAATARLTEIPHHLHAAIERLVAPSRALVVSTAARLDDVVAYLDTYAASWPDADAAARSRLAAAIGAARDAAATSARTLREDVSRREKPEVDIGPENVALVLRELHGLEIDAGTLYERAAAALRDAHDEMRGLLRAARASRVDPSPPVDEDWIRRLRRDAGDWVASVPEEPGIRVLPMPVLWTHHSAHAAYLDAGPAGTGVVFVRPQHEPRTAFDRAYDEFVRLLVLAHETYPGHRLESLFRRDVCALRRFVDDRVFVEGWGAYAEDLALETGALPDGPMARYAVAERRANRARETMIGLLLATGAANESEVLDLLQWSGWPQAGVEDVGAWARSTCYEVNYFLGAEEIRALRREEEERLGAGFDLRAFHTRLLREGPIPVPLIRRQWREERER